MPDSPTKTVGCTSNFQLNETRCGVALLTAITSQWKLGSEVESLSHEIEPLYTTVSSQVSMWAAKPPVVMLSAKDLIR